MTPPKILCFCGSIRSGSLSTRLLDSAVGELSLLDCEITRISLEDYPLPLYNGDDEAKDGVPENAVKLAGLLASHDGCFITCPEYNGSLTPLMKNTIDWITRVPSGAVKPFHDKVIGIGACSPGAMGGIGVLRHLREIFTRLGALVISEQVAVGSGGSAFGEMDNLTDERSAKLLKATCKSLATKAVLLKV